MAQADYIVENASGAAVRGDINVQLSAVVTNNSGASAPSPTFPFQWWPDESVSPPILRQRNAANTAWLDVAELDATSGLWKALTPRIVKASVEGVTTGIRPTQDIWTRISSTEISFDTVIETDTDGVDLNTTNGVFDIKLAGLWKFELELQSLHSSGTADILRGSTQLRTRRDLVQHGAAIQDRDRNDTGSASIIFATSVSWDYNKLTATTEAVDFQVLPSTVVGSGSNFFEITRAKMAVTYQGAF